MGQYQRLTKTIKDENGKEAVVCILYGTDECRKIHKDGCSTCPMMAAMMNQLACFEECFIQNEGSK